MEFKRTFSFSVKLKCPRCGENIEAMGDKPIEKVSLRCGHCGENIEISPGPERLFDSKWNFAFSKGPGASSDGAILQDAFDGTWARAVSWAFNAGAILAAIWLLVYPAPYGFITAVNMAIPPLAIVIAAWSGGAINLLDVGKSEKPTLTAGVILPMLILALRTLSDFEMDDYTGFWPPFFILTAGITLAARMGAPDLRGKWGAPMVFAPFAAAYIYGAMVAANCLPDRTAPEAHQVKIVAKRVSKSGKSDSFYFTVTPWGQPPAGGEIRVKRDLYDAHETGEKIVIYQKRGYLGFPWHYLEGESQPGVLAPGE